MADRFLSSKTADQEANTRAMAAMTEVCAATWGRSRRRMLVASIARVNHNRHRGMQSSTRVSEPLFSAVAGIGVDTARRSRYIRADVVWPFVDVIELR